jgi:hypothetical protein
LAGRAKVKADAAVATLLGPGASIIAYAGSRLTARRTDGTVVHASLSSYGQLLHECVVSGRWTEALRLARFVKQEPLWAALASLALAGSRPNLDAAEAALAAIKAVDRLAWVSYVRGLALPERRNAELALYRRQPDEAEGILLQVRVGGVGCGTVLQFRGVGCAVAGQVARAQRASLGLPSLRPSLPHRPIFLLSCALHVCGRRNWLPLPCWHVTLARDTAPLLLSPCSPSPCRPAPLSCTAP